MVNKITQLNLSRNSSIYFEVEDTGVLFFATNAGEKLDENAKLAMKKRAMDNIFPM